MSNLVSMCCKNPLEKPNFAAPQGDHANVSGTGGSSLKVQRFRSTLESGHFASCFWGVNVFGTSIFRVLWESVKA